MKNKNVIYLVISVALIVLLLILAAVYRSPNNQTSLPIVGTWNYMVGDKVDYGVFYKFEKYYIGSYAYKGKKVNITYTAKDGKLTIKYVKR